MKLKSTVLGALGFAFIFTLSARADKGPPHGTAAVVCRSNGVITRAEVLDLYEARELYQVRVVAIQDVALARKTMLANLRRRYAPTSLYPFYLESTLAELHPHFKVLPRAQHIPLLPDTYPRINAAGCRIEQLSSFDGVGDIQLDSDILGALDATNRLSLEMNETVSFLDRQWAKATDSVFARRLVGLLLADTWGTKLDAAVKGYALNVPGTGKYISGIGACSLRLEVGLDGSLRVTPDDICRTSIDWAAFQQTGYAVLFPSGKLDEWAWMSRDSSTQPLLLKRIDLNNLNLGSVAFRRTAN